MEAIQTPGGRQLQALTFLPSQILTRDLPCDSVYRSIQFRLSGAVQTTFASGTPVADNLSTFDNLIPRIDIIVGGRRHVKSVRPWAMRMQQLFTTGILAERRSSAAAAPATGNFPTTDQGFVYGSTTNYTTVAESILVSFEMPYAAPEKGRDWTWLDIRKNLTGISSAEIRLTTASYLALLGFGNTAPVTYGNSSLVIDIFTNEVPDAPQGKVRFDYRQSTFDEPITGQVNNKPVDLKSRNILTDVMLMVKDGAAGTATTATGKMPNNLLLTSLVLKSHGNRDRIATTFQALQAKNRLEYGVQAPFASGVSLMDGVAHMNFLTDKDLRSALDLRSSDSCVLYLSSESGSVVSYTNPAMVTIMVGEVVPVQ